MFLNKEFRLELSGYLKQHHNWNERLDKCNWESEIVALLNTKQWAERKNRTSFYSLIKQTNTCTLGNHDLFIQSYNPDMMPEQIICFQSEKLAPCVCLFLGQCIFRAHYK